MLCVQKIGPYSQKLLAKKRKRKKSSRNTARVGKRQWRTVSSQLAFSNIYNVLHPEKLENKVSCQNNTKRVKDVQHILQLLREVQIKVELEKLENYEKVAVKALLDSGATDLFIDTKFAKEKGFKLERLKNPMLV